MSEVWNKETQKLETKAETPKKDLHAVHDDTIYPPIESMATNKGEMFDSMTKYKAHLKQHGFEITGGSHNDGARNAGDKPAKEWTEEDLREAARKAEWGMLKPPECKPDMLEARRKILWGMAPASEKEKAQWTEEERMYQQFKKRRKA